MNETENTTANKREPKLYVIEAIISFVVISVLALIIAIVGITQNHDTMRILADAFSLSGLLGILFWGLIWVSQKGAFDGLIYSVRKVIDWTFRIHPENSKLPHTYGEYVAMKRAKKRYNLYIALIVSGVYFLVGLIFIFIIG